MGFKVKDHYYKKAKSENFVARSVYKLEELDLKFNILSVGDHVLDLGYFPGSWIQYSSKRIGKQGSVVGIDIQPINKKIQHLDNVTLYEKDIFTINHLSDLNVSQPFDAVVSDMAPSTSGIKLNDQMRSLELVEKVFDFLPLALKNTGNFTIKVFESQDAQDFLKSKKDLFSEIHFFRPKSTRSVSKEYFFVGKGYKGYAG